MSIVGLVILEIIAVLDVLVILEVLAVLFVLFCHPPFREGWGGSVTSLSDIYKRGIP